MLSFKIDGEPISLDVSDDTQFSTGPDLFLSEQFSDITRDHDWYEDGYTRVDSDAFLRIDSVRESLHRTISAYIKASNPSADLDDFSLDKYHKYVNEQTHYDVIDKTRQLTASDINIDIDKFLANMSEYFRRPLGWTYGKDYDPKIIARINMPQSTNFNPPHKDIYQVYDTTGSIPTIVNIWIPIIGVSSASVTGLPVVPGSHLLSERLIDRSKAGSVVNGRAYKVNCIKTWEEKNNLTTVVPSDDELLIFSSFLIHGAALNRNVDTTRISLEFRLFDKQ